MPNGRWGGLDVQLSLPGVTSVLDGVGSIASITSGYLTLGLETLNAIRGLTVPTIDPLGTLSRNLVTLCDRSLSDLRDLGLYGHFGDLDVVRSGGVRSLKGGYSKFQQRMISRLRDPQDLTRPVFTGDAVVFALFVYTSVEVPFTDGIPDTTSVNNLTRPFRQIQRLLGVNPGLSQKTLPYINTPTVSYGLSTSQNTDPVAGILRAASRVAGRSSAVLTWSLQRETSGSPATPPAGFIVEVCCHRDGFGVGWASPRVSGTTTDGDQPYIQGLYRTPTGDPLRVFGGVEQILVPDNRSWGSNTTGSTTGVVIREGSRPVFFMSGMDMNSPISNPFAKRPDGKYINGRRFYVPRSAIVGQSLVGGSFSIELRTEDLPLRAEIQSDGSMDIASATLPSTVYARVIPVGDSVSESNISTFAWNPKPHESEEDSTISVTEGFTPEDMGIPSVVVPVQVPSATSDRFTMAVQTAMALTLLTRSDLRLSNQDPLSSGTPILTSEEQMERYGRSFKATGLEAASQNLSSLILQSPQRYFDRVGSPPETFLRDLSSKINAVADRMLRAHGSPSDLLLQPLRQDLDRVLSWKWSDSSVEGVSGNPSLSKTVLESVLLPDPPIVARNVRSLPAYWQLQGQRTPVTLDTQARDSMWRSGVPPTFNGHLSVPVLYDRRTSRVWSVREVVPEQVLRSCSKILSFLSGNLQTSGSWTYWRPFTTDSTIGSHVQILERVKGVVSALGSSTQAIGSGLDETIHGLEQKIRELEEISSKIESYLNLPFGVHFPDAVSLPLVVRGTEGVVSGLLQSENAPEDGDDSYGGGFVILAGGLPSVGMDLLISLLSG